MNSMVGQKHGQIFLVMVIAPHLEKPDSKGDKEKMTLLRQYLKSQGTVLSFHYMEHTL